MNFNGFLAVVAIGLTAVPCMADQGIVLPAQCATVSCGHAPNIFGTTAFTTQYVYSGSLLSGLPVGSVIDGISFRLESGAATAPAANTSYSQWNLTLSPSVNHPGSLDPKFGTNVGTGAVVVFAGALTLSAYSLPGGARGSTPNAFGPEMTFSTPYTYTGGDLLLSVTHTAASGGPGVIVDWAASATTLEQQFALTYNAPIATFSDAGAPVIQFYYRSPSPLISPAGIVPIYSASSTIEPGEWVSIYGTNLAAANTLWNGDFPTTLGGTSVTINGKPGYLWFVSPTQINLQAPSDVTGIVPVVVTTQTGSVSSTVVLAAAAPSFSLLDNKHVAGIILRPDGSGTQGGGSYDNLGPTGISLGYPTVAARAGDSVELFGVGFGPTNPTVLAG